MALAVAATFASLSEAQIAAGALRASGFEALVFDDNFGTMMWMDQVAIGGFRVIVPEAEQAESAAFLRAVATTAPRRRPSPREKGVLWRVVALLTGLALPAVGWLVVGVRRRATFSNPAGVGLIAMVSVALIIAVASGFWLIGVIGAFMDSWLIHPRISS